MDAINVFEFSDYRELLVRLLKSEGTRWGAVGQIAAAIGCQRSYLSKVLHGKAELTMDQAHAVARYLSLSLRATEYFLALVERSRAASPAFRAHIEKRLAALKREQENLSEKVERPRAPEDFRHAVYYSVWYYSAVHILTSVPGFQAPAAIAGRLQLPSSLVLDALKQLAEMGLVEKNGRGWNFKAEIHVPAQSPLVALHHGNWRQRAVIDSARANDGGIHFTTVQAVSKADFERIRQNLLQFIQATARLAAPSPSEELYNFNCDLFRV
jgi:uncharacterized protein (TIGR02147 family)